MVQFEPKQTPKRVLPMIKAEIIADSINPSKDRITSWILIYPRFIHSEVMTHRKFSRNASSSRAVPIEKAIQLVQENPATPEFWGANQKGMQSAQELSEKEKIKAKDQWFKSRDQAVKMAKKLLKLGLHKQIANRVLEPFAHITVMVTATEYENFFSLRAHPDAQPEFQVLAYRMLNLYLKNKPVQRDWDEWHIPFGDNMPKGTNEEHQLKIATARAARVSYLTFDGETNIEKDFALHDRLMKSWHWSPFEHCARASEIEKDFGNFTGWLPYRKIFSDENRTGLNLKKVLSQKPSWIKL